MLEFKANQNENKGLYDVSLIQINSESPEKEALKSVRDSFFNNLVVSFTKLIIATNLVLIGHMLYENKVDYELFMTFQIGVFILEIFGKFFIVGILKHLFEDKEDIEELYKLYIKIKIGLIFLIPIIVLPISICSYFIIGLLSKYNLEIYDQILIKKVYYQFLLFTPIIYLFELLFILNLQFLQYQKKTRDVFLYIIFFMIAHISCCWIFLYILETDIYGLTISYVFNTFLFYLSSNRYIRNLYDETKDNFFIFPKKEYFTCEIFTLLKEKAIQSLINIGDIFYIYFLFLATLFTDKKQLIVNIIYINFYVLVNAINRGFYFSLKRHISTKIEEAQSRQRYVATFSFYFMVLCLSLFLLLIIFENILLNIYIYKGGDEVLQIISIRLRIIFPLCFLISCIRMLLNGIVRGMNIISLSIIKKIIYFVIGIVLCLILCFDNDYGIYGLWMSTFILNILLLIDTMHKAFNPLRQFFHI